MCGMQLKDRIRFKNLMLGLNVSIGQLAMANSVHCDGHVLRREDVHVLDRALDLGFESQRRNVRLMST